MPISYRIPIPAISFQPPVYICRYNDKPFTLDGNLLKDFWKDIPFTDEFIDIEGPIRPMPRFSTRAKMAWDKEHLYIGAILYGDEIWGTLTERESVIFYDNDFEIFIDPDSDTQQYYEYEMNAKNTVWDLMLTKAYHDMGKPVNGFDFHGLRSAVYIDGTLNDPSAQNKYWSVEVVLPFSALSECAAQNRPPVDGEYYRLNFSRVQWLVDIVENTYKKRLKPDGSGPLPEDNWVWAPTGVINIHYPELWGFLFFSESNQSDDHYVIPNDEYRKWELRKLYYAEQAHLDENGCYTDQLDVLLSILRRLSPCKENSTVAELPYRVQTTRHTFEISCPDCDGIGELSIFSDGKVTHFASRSK
ncbi:MAG: carbohydrate-binding family 9-like protein [Lachnospiraceae bacterium]